MWVADHSLGTLGKIVDTIHMKTQNNILYSRLNTQNFGAILWILAGTLLFSIVFASAKLFDSTLAPVALIFIRYTVGFLVMLTLKGVLRFELSPPLPRKMGMHAIRAFFGGSGGIAAIYAAAHLPVAKAASVGLLDGVIAVLLGIAFLRERISILRITGLTLAMIGAYLIVFHDVNTGAQFTTIDGPTMVALLGAFLVASEGLLIRILAQQETAHSVLFYVNMFGAIIFAIPGLYYLSSASFGSIWPLCFLGPIAIIGQYCNVFGYRSADLAIVAPVGYSWALFAMVILLSRSSCNGVKST